MKVSHRCPYCDEYNKVAGGYQNGTVLEFSCEKCHTTWERLLCPKCKGTGFNVLDICKCDGGMVPNVKPKYQTVEEKKVMETPVFGEKKVRKKTNTMENAFDLVSEHGRNKPSKRKRSST